MALGKFGLERASKKGWTKFKGISIVSVNDLMYSPEPVYENIIPELYPISGSPIDVNHAGVCLIWSTLALYKLYLIVFV